MSIMEVQGRITEIQAQLALLGTARAASTRASAGASAAFAATLATEQAAGSTAGAAGAGGGVSGQDVVAEAKKYLGLPYVWGGTDPKKGLDCSGLVQLVYKNLGIDLPRVSYQQAAAGRPVASMAEAQPGDLIAWDNSSRNNGVDHIAIYIGGGKMIEAPRTGLDVRVTDVYETPSAIRRVLPDPGTSATSATGGVGRTGSTAGDVPYADLFNKAASTYGVDAQLLAAIAKQESGFDPSAVSPAGAQGLMQLMPGTADALGVTNSFDPQQAVDGAARLMDDLLDRFGSTKLALAAYNAGPGAVMRYDGVPPYPETQNYVRSIMAMLGEN